MTNKFQNKYRIQSSRLQNWDYRWAGAYFITICTKNREHYFGEIENGEIILSEIGRIVEQEWLKTFDMRPDMNLQMGDYQVMPNHFHGIIIIGENEYNKRGGGDGGDGCNDHCRDAMHCVSTTSSATPTSTPITPSPNEINTPKNRFGPQSKNLGSVIRGFKIGVTANARMINPDFAWQERYHDHIIRDEQLFNRIQKYIRENPKKWVDDKFYNK